MWKSEPHALMFALSTQQTFTNMAAQPWRTAVVTRIEEEATDTRRFWFRVPELDRFDFIPGQFVTFDLPIHEKQNKRWRSYSIASAPDGTNEFELVIVLNPEGLGTNYMWKEFGIGTEVLFRGPQGVFTLNKETEKQDLFLICTGTGIAPFRSMVQDAISHGTPYQHIYLIFGTRTKASLLYHEELSKVSADHPNIQYIPVLSREDWEGEKGYVHQVYERLAAAGQPADFFLCGWKNMIDEAKRRIQELGYDRKSIHQEIYG
jgi:CDP-4-dehydro-6-deoxyglucose reductase